VCIFLIDCTAFADSFTHFAEQLSRPLQAPTLTDTPVQLPSHSTYHCGQVNARLRELGGDPPLVNYIAWVWFGPPEPIW
jgi:hypothetical protein